MINAAICNDDPVLTRIFTSILSKISTSFNFMINITEYNDEENSKNWPELMIIDDHYHGNGFQAAKELRKNGCESEIIFLLSAPDNWTKTYDFNPAACLIKPVLFEDISYAVSETVKHMISAEMIDFRTRHSFRTVMADDIIYIEADGRYTNIRTSADSFECTESISTLSGRLSPYQFFRSHRTYILNLRYISDIFDNVIRMNNGEIAVISRNRRSKFEDALKKFRNKYTNI